MPETLTMQQTAPERDMSATETEWIDRSVIDQSVRTPVMFFFTTAQTWLLAATLIGFVCSIKLHWPTFLGDWSFLTFGRLWPAYTNILVYGWGLPAGIGTSIWMTARLCRVELRAPWIPIISGIFWNIGVTVGVIAVLAGNMQPYELLEFPREASVLLFIAYALIGAWGVVMFQNRGRGTYIFRFGILSAPTSGLPGSTASANLMVGSSHLNGVVNNAVAAWYAQGLLGYFFASVGLGAVYYLIPKVIGRPIHSYNLALLGFWSFELFWGLTGMVRFTGGPFPVWYSSLSIAALILRADPGRHRGGEHPHDDARAQLHGLSQPDDALHDVRHGGVDRRDADHHPRLGARDGSVHAFHTILDRLVSPAGLCVFHDDDVWRDVLHRAAAGGLRMAFGELHPAAFLGRRLRHGLHDPAAHPCGIHPGRELE